VRREWSIENDNKEKKRGIFIQFLVGNFSFFPALLKCNRFLVLRQNDFFPLLLNIFSITCDWFIQEKFYGLAYFIRFSWYVGQLTTLTDSCKQYSALCLLMPSFSLLIICIAVCNKAWVMVFWILQHSYHHCITNDNLSFPLKWTVFRIYLVTAHIA